MDREEIEEYVQRCQQLIESSPQMDEENTKVKLVQPFLELLGWDLYSTEVALEYNIPMASGSTHVDYALLVGDSPVVFVEAKPLRSTLADKEVQQLRSYMRQELDVDWGILTNGKSFEVLTKNRHHNGGEEVSVVQFDLDDLAENPNMLELLTKESIRSGKSDEIAEQVAQTNRAIRSLQEREDDVSQSITNAVEREIGDLTIDLQEQSREFVQNLVSVLREKRQFVGEEATTGSDDSMISSTTGTANPAELEPKVDRVAGTIARADIEGNSESRVAVFPTRESGLTFLKENEAWGFVRVGSDFDFVAMYVTGDVREVQYFAEVEEVVTPEEADLERDPLRYIDQEEIAEDKLVIKFKPGTLYELEDPIPYNSEYLRSLRYTTLGALKSATTTDELFGSDGSPRTEPNPLEDTVLEAVNHNPGSTLSSIHQTVAEFENSPIEWEDEWGEERTEVQEALHNLRDMNLVRLEDRTWYPAESEEF